MMIHTYQKERLFLKKIKFRNNSQKIDGKSYSYKVHGLPIFKGPNSKVNLSIYTDIAKFKTSCPEHTKNDSQFLQLLSARVAKKGLPYQLQGSHFTILGMIFQIVKKNNHVRISDMVSLIANDTEFDSVVKRHNDSIASQCEENKKITYLYFEQGVNVIGSLLKQWWILKQSDDFINLVEFEKYLISINLFNTLFYALLVTEQHKDHNVAVNLIDNYQSKYELKILKSSEGIDFYLSSKVNNQENIDNIDVVETLYSPTLPLNIKANISTQTSLTTRMDKAIQEIVNVVDTDDIKPSLPSLDSINSTAEKQPILLEDEPEDEYALSKLEHSVDFEEPKEPEDLGDDDDENQDDDNELGKIEDSGEENLILDDDSVVDSDNSSIINNQSINTDSKEPTPNEDNSRLSTDMVKDLLKSFGESSSTIGLGANVNQIKKIDADNIPKVAGLNDLF